MKTEDIRATEIAITPYLTLILFSVPDSNRAESNAPGSSISSGRVLANEADAREWSLPSLVRTQESPLHV